MLTPKKSGVVEDKSELKKFEKYSKCIIKFIKWENRKKTIKIIIILKREIGSQY